MRPSSSPSSADPPGLFDEVLARGPVRAVLGDRAWLQAMLDTEAALARAQARAGLIAAEDADAIASACRADRFDLAAIGREAAASGNPVVPLVNALAAAVEGPAADRVHLGATSQDILDSAAMLLAREACDAILVDLDAAASRAAALAEEHRDLVMPARTLLQQALPTTFGLKAAGWVTALGNAGERLAEARGRLPGQLGGAAGTQAALGPAGIEVAAGLCQELGLAEPTLPWHTDRGPVLDVAAAVGRVAAAVAKVAGDVVLLAQTEVGEVREGGGDTSRGGSSTLPQKANPVAAVSAVACAEQAPGLLATLFAAAGRHQHERAAGAWHAEWRPLTALLVSAGSAAAWLRDCLERLEVVPERMTANLTLTGGGLVAERLAGALGAHLGRRAANDLVRALSLRAAAEGADLEQLIGSAPEVAAVLDEETRRRLADPAGYAGNAAALTDRAVRAFRQRRHRTA